MRRDAEKAWYEAFKAKDARFDGRFFVAISSTGIYCRPVCRARLPKADNCSFFATAAEAEQAGYRPCLLCRPEQAPGSAPVDAAASLAQRAARLLEQDCGRESGLEEYAKRLGCTARHLRRVFTAEYKVSPLSYLQTCRLLLAKNLLTDTKLSVLEVAMAAGFGSLRRFNYLFKKHYRLTPGSLRKLTGRPAKAEAGLRLTLSYRPPYQWDSLLDFLSRRAIAGVEMVKDGEYFRTVRLTTPERGELRSWLRVSHLPRKNALAVVFDSSLLPALPALLARIRHLFDLNCDPEAIYSRLELMNDLRPGLCVPGLRLPGCFDAFEMSVRAILGQQISVKAAGTLAARFAEAYGEPVQSGPEGLSRTFPSPQTIVDLPGPIDGHLGPLGINKVRAEAILSLARSMLAGDLDFSCCSRPENEIIKLTAIAGIGSWTAQYIAMRVMAWPDAFLPTDCGIKKALAPKNAKEISEAAEAWRPWRSYAAINLWNSL